MSTPETAIWSCDISQQISRFDSCQLTTTWMCKIYRSRAYVSNLNRIFYLQKRATRAITNSDYRAHSDPLITKLGILDIFEINTFQITKFMSYYHNQWLPQMFHNLFITSSQLHNYGTRTASDYLF